MGKVNEEWKPIKGYEGLYSISNLGNVMAHSRKVAFGNQTRYTGEHLMSQTSNGTGYLKVYLNVDGSKKSFFVHRLVALAFCEGHHDETCEVNHIDYNKQNNNASNLEWVTRKANVEHSRCNFAKRHIESTLTGERYIGVRNGRYRVTVGGDKSFDTLQEAILYRDKKCAELGVDLTKQCERKWQRKRDVSTGESMMETFA